ncbi:MAG: copper amine oxidase N-terminal domain-containing protein [Firmicutes bacterium]|nr:copper amine oxidase N-terminal domain-containing protein [Bacillota bacterium]
MRKLAILLTVIFIFSLAAPAMAGDDWKGTISSTVKTLKSTAVNTVNTLTGKTVKLYVNDTKINPDVPPFIDENSRTMVPLRFAAEALGCDVEWLAESRTVEVKRDSTDISLVIGEKKAEVNGELIALDTNAIIKGSRTMVPLRFISESLGAQVEWVADEYAVYITDEEVKVPEPEVIDLTGKGEPIPKDLDNCYGDSNKINWVSFKDIKQNIYEIDGSKIYDMQVGKDKIIVTQSGSIGAVQLHLWEGGNIARFRGSSSPTKEKYDCEYSVVNDRRDKYGNLPTADITKVPYILLGGGPYEGTVLGVNNPLYQGR